MSRVHISPWRGMHRSRGALSRRRLGPSLLYPRSVVCIIFIPGQRDPNSSKRWKASIHAARLRLLSARSAPGSESPEPILLVTARPAIGCADERVHFCVDFYPDGLFSRDRDLRRDRSARLSPRRLDIREPLGEHQGGGWPSDSKDDAAFILRHAERLGRILRVETGQTVQ